MPRRASLKPKKIKTPAGARWRLVIPASLNTERRPINRYFDTKEEADLLAGTLRRKRQRLGEQGHTLAPAVLSDAVQAHRLLEPYGVTLTEAANAHIARLLRSRSSKPFGEVFEAFIASEERSSRYASDLRATLKRMPEPLRGQPVSEIHASALEAALDAATGSATVFDTRLRQLRAVFAFAVRKKWVGESIAAEIEPKAKKRRRGERKSPAIVTLSEARAIFDACERLDHPGAIPAFAVMLFAGVRPEEAKRLDWGDIDLASRNIRVPAAASKTDVLRNIHIEENLIRWLVPHRRAGGRLVPDNWKRVATAVRSAAGISEKQNALRHSYGSYWLPVFKDVRTLSLRMGHGSEVYFKHYEKVVPEAIARRFWKITPRRKK